MVVNTPLFCLVFMHLPSCLALIELAVHRDGGQQLLVRANRRFAVPHENNVLQLREVIQPVRDQEDDLIVCVGLQGCKNGILRAAVQRGKRIVQNQNGPWVGKRSGQGQPLRLAAGKAACRCCRSRYPGYAPC